MRDISAHGLIQTKSNNKLIKLSFCWLSYMTHISLYIPKYVSIFSKQLFFCIEHLHELTLLYFHYTKKVSASQIFILLLTWYLTLFRQFCSQQLLHQRITTSSEILLAYLLNLPNPFVPNAPFLYPLKP